MLLLSGSFWLIFCLISESKQQISVFYQVHKELKRKPEDPESNEAYLH